MLYIYIYIYIHIYVSIYIYIHICSFVGPSLLLDQDVACDNSSDNFPTPESVAQKNRWPKTHTPFNLTLSKIADGGVLPPSQPEDRRRRGPGGGFFCSAQKTAWFQVPVNDAASVQERQRLLVADKLGQRSWGRRRSDDFDRLGKKVRPGTFGEIEVIRLMGVPKKFPLSKNMKIAVTPLVLTPSVPFRAWHTCSAMCVWAFDDACDCRLNCYLACSCFEPLNFKLWIIYIYIYIYTHTHTYTHIHMYIYI